jgi:hypothetical protein
MLESQRAVGASPSRTTARLSYGLSVCDKKCWVYSLSCPSLQLIFRPCSLLVVCFLIDKSSGMEKVSRSLCLVDGCMQLLHWQLSRSQILGITFPDTMTLFSCTFNSPLLWSDGGDVCRSSAGFSPDVIFCINRAGPVASAVDVELFRQFKTFPLLVLI